MKILVAEKLSEHRYKTPEGYLICVDSILARTGKQTYNRSEIFGDSENDGLIEVDRKAEEVFSPETMASFENKPICVEHPDVDVNSGNISEFAVGFVRDIHKGEYEGEPVMLGTLVITDAKTVEEIEEGKHTDLSCGYDCDIDDSENPQQRNIRGNHVALCEQGRAGIARIMDSVDEESTYTEVTKNLEKKADKDMSWLDSVIKDSNDFVNSYEHRRLIYEFMENNGNSFIISKEKNRLLKYIEKETGIKNADWHDVMYIIKNHTRAKLFDEEIKDAILSEYEIRWIDKIAKSRGESRESFVHNDIIKARTVKEALQSVANRVALGGIGTANTEISSVNERRDGKTISYVQLWGKLSDIIKKV